MTELELTRKADNRGRVTLGPEFGDEQVTMAIERSIDIDRLPVMRAVHFMTGDEQLRAQLYAGADRQGAEALFGVHWHTGPVWEETAYEEKSARADYNSMEKASEGALVSAYYGARAENLHEQNDTLLDDYLKIGVCPPDSDIRAVQLSHDDSGYVWVKTLPLVNTVEVARSEREELFEDNVQGLSVYQTDKKEEMIRRVYDQKRK